MNHNHQNKCYLCYTSRLAVCAICVVLNLLLASCSNGRTDSSETDDSAGQSTSLSEGTNSETDTYGSIGSTAKTTAATTTATTQASARTVRVLIPEGYSLSQIGDKLEANHVCTKAAFLATVNSYDFSYYSLVAQITENAHRCYKLEGYLFPNTYVFYTSMKPQDAIGKMLRGAQSNIDGKYSYSGLTTDQVITLASLIEKEAASLSDMENISSVFHNRLKIGMQLDSDATIYYIERYVKPNLTGDINRYNAFYNTYKCAALPAGPICNPGANALYTACHPNDTDYLYFWTDTSGKYYYSKTPMTTSNPT